MSYYKKQLEQITSQLIQAWESPNNSLAALAKAVEMAKAVDWTHNEYTAPLMDVPVADLSRSVSLYFPPNGKMKAYNYADWFCNCDNPEHVPGAGCGCEACGTCKNCKKRLTYAQFKQKEAEGKVPPPKPEKPQTVVIREGSYV